MPEEWRKSLLISIYKNKGDAQCCGNYRGIKLMSHTMKVWERIIEARLRDRVEISKEQYGFMPVKGTTDAMFHLFFFIFISIFILLTRRKATEALIHRVGNYPDQGRVKRPPNPPAGGGPASYRGPLIFLKIIMVCRFCNISIIMV